MYLSHSVNEFIADSAVVPRIGVISDNPRPAIFVEEGQSISICIGVLEGTINERVDLLLFIQEETSRSAECKEYTKLTSSFKC